MASDEVSLMPEPRTVFTAKDNSFAFSPGQLSKLFNPKSLTACRALWGVEGLEKGLRTDRPNGLSLEETQVEENASFKDGVTKYNLDHADHHKFSHRTLIVRTAPVDSSTKTRVPMIELPKGKSRGYFKGGLDVLVSTCMGAILSLIRGATVDPTHKSPQLLQKTDRAYGTNVLETMTLADRDFDSFVSLGNGYPSASIDQLTFMGISGSSSSEVTATWRYRSSAYARITRAVHEEVAVGDRIYAPVGPHAYRSWDTVKHDAADSPEYRRMLLCFEHAVSNIERSLAKYYLRASQNRKLAIWGIYLFYSIPLVSAALRVVDGLRVASGVSACGSAVVIIPLRTHEESPDAAWIM